MINFVGDGEFLHHVLTEDVLAGEVVVTAGKGMIAVTDGSVGDTISLRRVGVVNLPLKPGGPALEMGTLLNYSAADKAVTADAVVLGDVMNFGYIAEDGVAGSDDFACLVLTPDAQIAGKNP